MLTRRDLIAGALLSPFQTRRPNVVLVMSDDQGYGDLSIHGNPVLRTPNIDRIAREGVQFTQFHVNPVCSPTRSSLLTGRYCYRTGVVDTYLGRSMMYPDEVTLPELLRDAGYRTGLFGKWHLGDHFPMRAVDQGFDHALVHDGGGIAQPSDPPEGNSYFDPRLKLNGRPVQRSGYCTDVFFEEALQFIAGQASRPFFACITPNAPHTPLQVGDNYVTPFRSAGLDDTTAKVYGMLVNLDQNIGRLLARLQTLGIERDTILIFMTDNGPQQPRYNAGMRGLKGTVYQGGIRVPCFLRWPALVKAGSRIATPAAHIDWLPTLLDACGVAKPRDLRLDGRSLLPLIRDARPSWPDRHLVFQWHRGDRPEPFRNCAIRAGKYKLVDGKELFDLDADPSESTGIAAHHPGIVRDLRRAYENWFRDMESTRNFELPRIYVGTSQENPVLLTRQDWRGPKAGWDAASLGHWDLDVRAPGDYLLELIVAPSSQPRPIRATLGRAEVAGTVDAGASHFNSRFANVPAGSARLEASIAGAGVLYAKLTAHR